jgi:hypothetical protein
MRELNKLVKSFGGTVQTDNEDCGISWEKMIAITIVAPAGRKWSANGERRIFSRYYKNDKSDKLDCLKDLINQINYGLE